MLLSFSLFGEVLQDYLVSKFLGSDTSLGDGNSQFCLFIPNFSHLNLLSDSLSDILCRNLFQLMLRMAQHIFLLFLSISLDFRVGRGE